MRIGIDGNLLCGKKTGMGNVVYWVIRYWKSDAYHKVIVFVPDKLDEDYTDILIRNGIKIIVLGKTNYFHWEQKIIPGAVTKYKIDVLWCPYNTAPLNVSCPIVVTIHDIIYMTLPLAKAPSIYKKAGVLYRRFIVPRIVKSAKQIITISAFAGNEITKRFPVAENKLHIVYNGADLTKKSSNLENIADFFAKNGIKDKYILGFGSLEARKNSLGLIKAYANLPESTRENYQLVLFGFRNFETSVDFKYINQSKLKNIVILEYISEQEKEALYQNSSLFVFPTFSEGFGIPILEAFANRTPVITSNVTSIPEVAGKAAIFINPNQIDEISKAIDRVLKDTQCQKQMISDGEKQVLKFSWERSSNAVWSILVDCCSDERKE